jgi:hypothetical protein
MTLTVFWIVGIISSIVIIISTSLTNSTVERIIRKFEIHPKLIDGNVIVTIDGKRLEGKDKIQVINDFNEALYLKKYNIIRGTEELYLHPVNTVPPLIIDITNDKKDVRLFVYRYNDRVDVVKRYKKKVVAYSLRSDSLQKCSLQQGNV